MGDTAFAKFSPDNGPMKWNRAQHSTGPGPELRKYDDQLFAPSLRILHMPAWMANNELRGWVGGRCLQGPVS
jgi:hypothetical protein